jgi:hypothetical protein
MTQASRADTSTMDRADARRPRREGIVMKLIRTGRRALASLVVVALIALAGTAHGMERDVHTDPGAESTSPVAFDLLVLRPLGIVGTLTGTVFFLAPVLPLTLVTRPNEIDEPFKSMVLRPAGYVLADPLGQH